MIKAMANVSVTETIKDELRAAGFKATSARVAVLALLRRHKKPLDVADIVAALPVTVDQATVYRTVRSLVESGLIRLVQLQSGVTHYELAALPHHHHVVCEQCGLVEDVDDCVAEQVAMPRTKQFRTVTRHSIEYFGVCKECS